MEISTDDKILSILSKFGMQVYPLFLIKGSDTTEAFMIKTAAFPSQFFESEDKVENWFNSLSKEDFGEIEH